MESDWESAPCSKALDNMQQVSAVLRTSWASTSCFIKLPICVLGFLTAVHGATLSSELKNKNCSSVVCSVVATLLIYYLLALCTASLFFWEIYFFEKMTLKKSQSSEKKHNRYEVWKMHFSMTGWRCTIFIVCWEAEVMTCSNSTSCIARRKYRRAI